MRLLVLSVLFLVCAPAQALFGPDNYYECLLDRMPGVANDFAARQVIADCSKEFPRRVAEKRSGWLHPTAGACILKHGKSTGSQLAGRAIAMACRSLYVTE